MCVINGTLVTPLLKAHVMVRKSVVEVIVVLKVTFLPGSEW